MHETNSEKRTLKKWVSDLSVAQIIGTLVIAAVIALGVFVILIISGLAMLT